MTLATQPPLARLFSFVGGDAGPWRVTRQSCVAGEPLAAAAAMWVLDGVPGELPPGAAWALQGITSNERYVERAEKTALLSRQEGLNRPASTCAALIPIRKSAAWWALTQDERRAVFEAQSHHIEIGLRYLPAIARRLHHCRDLAPEQPFDFLTWFEYAPADAAAFDEMLVALRSSPEWGFVERESDIRLQR